MKTIAVYGSLKQGKFNHSMIEEFTQVLETVVQGTMYSLGSYPALVDEGDKFHDIEVYQVDEKTFKSVDDMEIGAGYKRATIEVDCGEATIYYADTSLHEYCEENCKVIDKY